MGRLTEFASLVGVGPAARAQRVMPATPELVFDQWLDPESLAEWMCPRPVRVIAITVEPRVGGRRSRRNS